MSKMKGIIPLLVAVAIIVGAILVIENPFAGGESDTHAPTEPVVVIDAPEGLVRRNGKR